MVADLLDVELLADAGADGGDQRLDLVVLQHLVEAGPLDVEDLAADRQDRLDAGVAGLRGRAAGGVALDDEQLALAGVAARAVRRACRACPRPRGRDLRRVASRALRAATRARGRVRCAFLTILLGLGGVLLEPVGQLLVGGLLDQRAHRDVAELALGLALELRVAEPHRDDGGEALADVLALEVLVLLLEEALGPGVLVDHVGEGLRKPSSCMPPSMVVMPLAKQWRPSCGSRCSTGTRSRPPASSSICSK